MKYEGSKAATDRIVERSGFLAEADALGTIDTEDPEYRSSAERWYESNRELVVKFKQHRLSPHERTALFGSAFRLIEQHPYYRGHAERATAPEAPLLRDLRIAVADGLEWVRDEDLDRIEVYTAVGTPIDKHLGIDAFLKIRDKDGRYPATYVTLDYTINQQKMETPADVLVSGLPDPDLEEAAYVRAVHEVVGPQAVREYRRKVRIMQHLHSAK